MAPPERPRRANSPPAGRSPRPPRAGAPSRAAGAPKSSRKAGGSPAKPYQRRDDAERKPYNRREESQGRQRGDRPKPTYQGRTEGPTKPYQRRDDRPPRRDDRPVRAERPRVEERPVQKKWGGVTRRGARQVTNPTPASDEAKAYERREFTRAPRPEVDRWEHPDRPAPKRPAPKQATAKKGPPPRAKALPADVVAEVASAAANPRRAPMLQKRLGEAARHIQHGREKEAAGILRQLAQEVPEAASVRELYGQALYGLGRFRQAAAELEAFVELTHSADQHPMLADSYRALGRHKKVQELWADLREASPSPDIVAEGRIVTAGSLADQGKLGEAIKLLETSPPVRGRVAERHLRTWYALADLYERSGELSKSRALFGRIVQQDADFADASDRLYALG